MHVEFSDVGRVVDASRSPLVSAGAVDGDGLAAVLLDVGTGSVPAFAELYDLVAPRVHGLLRARLGAARAEDATRTAFEQVWRRAPRFSRDDEDALRWVLRVVIETSEHLPADLPVRTASRSRGD